ncbi:MAG: zinc ABC transporter substrate-binding protein [Saprospiraceae bacterium]
MARISRIRCCSLCCFQQQTRIYSDTLAHLHQWVADQWHKFPLNSEYLLPPTMPFTILAAYNVEVRGLQGISTLSNLDSKDRVDLVNFITDSKIRAVFVETSVSPRHIQSIVEATSEQKGARFA